MKLYIKDFFSKCEHIQETADLVTFTEEILHGKLPFLCSDIYYWHEKKVELETKIFTSENCDVILSLILTSYSWIYIFRETVLSSKYN